LPQERILRQIAVYDRFAVTAYKPQRRKIMTTRRTFIAACLFSVAALACPAAHAADKPKKESTLDVGSPSCRTVDFSPSIGDVAITLTVSCIVDLQAASMLPLPGSMTVSATATEAIDTHRESSGP
jgi:hypothetical protein